LLYILGKIASYKIEIVLDTDFQYFPHYLSKSSKIFYKQSDNICQCVSNIKTEKQKQLIQSLDAQAPQDTSENAAENTALDNNIISKHNQSVNSELMPVESNAS